MDIISSWLTGNIVGLYFLLFLLLLLYVLFMASPERVETRLNALKGHRTTITGFFLMTVLLVKQLNLTEDTFEKTFGDYTYFYLVIAAYIAAGRITKLTEVLGTKGIKRAGENDDSYYNDFTVPEQEYYYSETPNEE